MGARSWERLVVFAVLVLAGSNGIAAATAATAAAPTAEPRSSVQAKQPRAAAPVLLLSDGTRLEQLRTRLRANAPDANAPDASAPNAKPSNAKPSDVKPSDANDKTLKETRAALEALAAEALRVPPTSVMDKGIVPPSGDKHDYMSQAPYWWPNPAKPDGRPYIRRDGERNPEIKKLPDHDNLGRLTGTVRTLGVAYYLTGREPYAAHAARLVRTWFLDSATRMRPHLNFGQGIPGINDGRGIGIIETRGLPDLLDGVTLLAGSPSWTAADQDGLRAWMRDYLTWLTTSPHGQDEAKNGNNHETWYDVQVAGLALWTTQPAIAREVFTRAKTRIATQIEPDGQQPRELERTNGWHYSLFNLSAFFTLAGMSERTSASIGTSASPSANASATPAIDLWRFRSADGRSLRGALDYLTPFAAGERPWPKKELSGFNAAALASLLEEAGRRWPDAPYAALARRLTPDTTDARAPLREFLP